MDSGDGIKVSRTPQELVGAARNMPLNVLPNISREKYELAYKRLKTYYLENYQLMVESSNYSTKENIDISK